VRLTGFVLRTDSGWELVRLHISCCAADAFVSAIRVQGVPVPAARGHDDVWVTVTGHLAQDSSGDADPVLQASSIKPVSAPTNPYE